MKIFGFIKKIFTKKSWDETSENYENDLDDSILPPGALERKKNGTNRNQEIEHMKHLHSDNEMHSKKSWEIENEVNKRADSRNKNNTPRRK